LRVDQLVAFGRSDFRTRPHVDHVLDTTAAGRPAGSRSFRMVELYELGQSRVVTRAVTKEDAGPQQLIMAGLCRLAVTTDLLVASGTYSCRWRQSRCRDPRFSFYYIVGLR